MKALHRHQTMWLRFKVAMLANLSRKVRQDLAEARTHAAKLEVATVQQEVAGLQDLLQEQQRFGDTLDQVFQVRKLGACFCFDGGFVLLVACRNDLVGAQLKSPPPPRMWCA